MSGPIPDEALRARHQAAMDVIEDVDPDDRPLILAAVVWPEDPCLLGEENHNGED